MCVVATRIFIISGSPFLVPVSAPSVQLQLSWFLFLFLWSFVYSYLLGFELCYQGRESLQLSINWICFVGYGLFFVLKCKQARIVVKKMRTMESFNYFLLNLESESESRSVLSNSLWPRGLYSPWNSPGQNTGVGSLSLLQGIFPTQESNPGLPHCRWILYQLNHQGSPLNRDLTNHFIYCCYLGKLLNSSCSQLYSS